jgi:hypothetical protein
MQKDLPRANQPEFGRGQTGAVVGVWLALSPWCIGLIQPFHDA